MAEYPGGSVHNHVYVPDASDLAGEFREKFIKEVNEHEGHFQAEADTISFGIISKKEREVALVKGLGLRAWVVSFPVGPDLYIGYTVCWTGKEKLNEIENQNREAFAEYLRRAVGMVLEKIGGQ